MTDLRSLPADVIQVLVEHLDVPPWHSPSRFPPRKDALSLSSVCKRLRRTIFEPIWVKRHQMDFTWDQINKTREKIDGATRKRVQSLVLLGSCDEKITRPTLLDYVAVFPNLASVRIDLTYPNNHPGKDRQPPKATANRQAKAASAKATSHSLESVSLSIKKDVSWYGTEQERYTAKLVPHIKASLAAAGIDRLDSYHLEIATSCLKEDRDNLTFWKDLGKRIKTACAIPTKEFTLEFGEIRMDGQMGSFLDTLRAAIQGWPKRIDKIVIDVPTDDFIIDSKNVTKFKVDKKGQVTLVPGWIPTEKAMLAFVKTLKKDRPSLLAFQLVVSIRSAAFHPVSCKKVFEFTYAKTGTSKAKPKTTLITSGTKNEPIDVEDFVAKSVQKPKRSSEPEHRAILHSAVIQELYDAMKDFEEDSEVGGDGFDSYDEFEEEIAMMQERADEDAMMEDDDDSFGLGGRPRWAAY